MYSNTDALTLHTEMTPMYKKRLHKWVNYKRASSKEDTSVNAEIEVQQEQQEWGKKRYSVRGNTYTNCHPGCCQVVAQWGLKWK